MVLRNNWIRWLPPVIGLLLTIGCGPGGTPAPKTVPVSGTVLYNDQPVEGATVAFRAEGAPRPASGVTDAEGRFNLSTFDRNDGAIIGEHTVTVTKIEPGASAEPMDPSAMADPQRLVQAMRSYETASSGPKSLLPEKYSDPNATPLKESVTADGPNRFVIQLTD